MLATFEAEIELALDPDEPEGTPGRWTRAYIRLSFTTDERARDLGVAFTLMMQRRPNSIARFPVASHTSGMHLITMASTRCSPS